MDLAKNGKALAWTQAPHMSAIQNAALPAISAVWRRRFFSSVPERACDSPTRGRYG
jgi:hypothetical protein